MRSIAKKLFQLILGLTTGLFTTSCEPQDLEAIEPYRYQFPEFENIAPFPEVKIITPQSVDFELGRIIMSEELIELLEDIPTSINGPAITERSITILRYFESEKKTIPESYLNQHSTPHIDQILNTDLLLDQEYLELFQRVDQNNLIKNYLPTFVPPKIEGLIYQLYTIPPPKGRLKVSSSNKDSRILSTNPETLVTPCAKAAEESYQSHLNKYNDAFLQQILLGKKYYQTHREQILKVKETQIESMLDSVKGSNSKLRELAIAVNMASTQGFELNKFSKETYLGIKVFDIAFLVKSRRSLQLMRLNSLAALEEVYQRDLHLTDVAQNTYEIELTEQLDILVKELKKAKLRVLNNCHNQGGGSD
jgi:hypothetical protein